MSDAQAKAHAEQEKLEADVRTLKQELELSQRDTKRAEERIAVEAHKRSQAETALADTDAKLIASEALVTELRGQLADQKSRGEVQVAEANEANEALLQKCVADFKALTSQVERMQNAAAAQAQTHADESAKARREHERQMAELQTSYTKQIHALEQELQLTQAQLSDARTLAAAVQAELDGSVAAELARTGALNDNLAQFQAQHAKQIQELHMSLWKSDEEKKALNDKADAARRSVDDRRAEIQQLKEALTQEQRRAEEMERAATTARLRADRAVEESEEAQTGLRDSIRALTDAQRSLQQDRDSQSARAAQAQALADEYEKQLKAARAELLALHRAEEEQIERRLASDPAVQQQFHQLGAELSNMSAHLRATHKGLPPVHPAGPSFPHLTIPSSARSYAQQRAGNVTPPEERERSSRGGGGGSRPASSSAMSPMGNAMHSPRPYTPAFSDDMGPVSLPGSMPTSPLPVRPGQQHGLSVRPSGDGGDGQRARAEPSPPRVVVEAPLISLLSDSHNALAVETNLPPSRRSELARKQSITSPNINLNHGTSSLETIPRQPSIDESKEDSRRRRRRRAAAAAGAGARNNQSDSGSDEDFVEQPLSDSSMDNNSYNPSGGRYGGAGGGGGGGGGGAGGSSRQAIPLSIQEHPLDEHNEELLHAELVEEGNTQRSDASQRARFVQAQQYDLHHDPQQLSPHSEHGQGHSQGHSRGGSHHGGGGSSHHDSSHSTEDSQAELERSMRRLRADKEALQAQNDGLSGIIRQMKKELEQLMAEQSQQASQRSAAETARLAQLEAALAAKSKEVEELKSTPPPPLHPFYAPQFPPPPSSYGASPLGYGAVPPHPLYPPYGSYDQQRELALEQEYVLQSAAANRDRDRRREDRREEEEASAAAAATAAAEYDRRRLAHEEYKEQVALSSSRSRSGSSSAAAAAAAGNSIELSLSGTGVSAHMSGSGRREVAFHSSDRATDSQRDASRALRIRAEIHRKKDASIKARADVARAKVREQMRRNKEVEAERQRAAAADLDF